MEASSFTPSVYSVHALTLLAEVKHSCLCDSFVPVVFSVAPPLFSRVHPKLLSLASTSSVLGAALQHTNTFQLSSLSLIHNRLDLLIICGPMNPLDSLW